jgi:hypothetical protein
MPAHMRQAGGVGPRAMHRHASVAHNPILNGASVISGPFIGVELTSWKARTQPQATAVFSLSHDQDPDRKLGEPVSQILVIGCYHDCSRE